MKLREILHLAPVIPVVTIHDMAQAVPLAAALVAGGLRAIEITLRTAHGLAAIRAIDEQVPGAVVGVGTVLEPAQMTAAAAAGAKFFVAPGVTEKLLDAAAQDGLALLPGVATASEAMRLIERGYEFAKFFPAESSGGSAFLSAISSPLPQLRFCPTGGITAETERGVRRRLLDDRAARLGGGGLGNDHRGGGAGGGAGAPAR
jgi:2-dehydro-3-deoxyphosphogluconate aldolase/(4S)-4-hydroxy-2-oxoglutarate aldolase